MISIKQIRLLFESREQFIKLVNLSDQELQTIVNEVIKSIKIFYKNDIIKHQKTILSELHRVSKLVDRYILQSNIPTSKSKKGGKQLTDGYNDFAKSDNKILQLINKHINNFVRSQGIRVDPFASLKTYDYSDKGNKVNGFRIYINIIKRILNRISSYIENLTTLSPVSKKLIDVLNKMLELNEWDSVNISQPSILNQILDKMLELNVDTIEISNHNTQEQINNVLEKMLSFNDESGNNITPTTTSKYSTFKCIRKNDPNLSDKQYRYDVYVPTDENYAQQLKEKLGIEFFALQYTTKEPSEMERVLRNPTNVNKLMNAQNCQFAAFGKDNKPLLEYRSWNCHLERSNNKNEFKLVNGTFPNLSSPDREYSKEQFINIAEKYVNDELINTTPAVKQCAEILLGVVFDDLSNRQAKNMSYANFLTQQIATNDKAFIEPLKNLLNYAVTSLFPVILDNQQKNQQNAEQSTNSTEQQ